MRKKNLGLAVAIVMLFAIVALSGCSNYDCECEPYKHECVEECGDFCLSISADCTRLGRGDSMEVTISFRNLSGKTLELSELGLIPLSPFRLSYGVPRMILLEDLVIEDLKYVEHNFTMTHSELMNGSHIDLSRGSRELTFRAQFYINKEPVNVNSNTILITVR